MTQSHTYFIEDPYEPRTSKQPKKRGRHKRGGRTRPPRRFRRTRWILSLLALVVIILLLRAPILRGLASLLDVSEPIEPAAYVLVAAGRPAARPFYAAALYRAGLTYGVLVTRPQPVPDVLDGIVPPEEELTQNILIQQGVHPDDIVILAAMVTDAASEVGALAAFLAQDPSRGDRVTVLTSAFQTRRYRRLLRRGLNQGAGEVRLLGIPEDNFSERNWWRTQSGFLTYLGEALEIVHDWLVH